MYPLLLVALNRCALRLAGHQSPRQSGCAGWDRLAESFAESGGIRGLVRVVLAGMGPQGEDLLKQLVVRDGTALLKVLLKAGASEVSAELF